MMAFRLDRPQGGGRHFTLCGSGGSSWRTALGSPSLLSPSFTEVIGVDWSATSDCLSDLLATLTLPIIRLTIVDEATV